MARGAPSTIVYARAAAKRGWETLVRTSSVLGMPRTTAPHFGGCNLYEWRCARGAVGEPIRATLETAVMQNTMMARHKRCVADGAAALSRCIGILSTVL